MTGVDDGDHKAVLMAYLGRLREAVLWKLEGLSERDCGCR